MVTRHKLASTVGAAGAVGPLAHVILGPDVVPPLVAVIGLAIVAIAAIPILMARRRS
jgi:hypothetical protein